MNFKALVNEKDVVTISDSGVVSSDANKALDTKVWKATSLMIKTEDKPKTINLSEAAQAIGKEAWIRTEEHGCAKLEKVTVLEVSDVVKA